MICEKPLATSSRETAILRALAESRPAQAAAVNYNIRYYPLCHEIRERIAGGSLGRVLSVTGSYVQDWLLYPEDYNWRVEPDGGTNLRAVADIGTHWMDLAQFLIGEPIRAVCADLATFHPRRFKPAGRLKPLCGPSETAGRPSAQEVEITTEDHAAILLRFEGGARGAFHVSQVTAGRKNRLTIEIAATEGAAFWDSESPNRLWLGLARRGPTSFWNATRLCSDRRRPRSATIRAGMPKDFPTRSSSFSSTSTGGSRSAQEGGRPTCFPTFADGHQEVCLCEAIARAPPAEGGSRSPTIIRPPFLTGLDWLTKMEDSYS